MSQSSHSRSQSRSLPRAASSREASEGHTASESLRHQTTNPTEDTTMTISSSSGSSPRTVLPPPRSAPVAAPFQPQGPHTRMTAHQYPGPFQPAPPQSFLDPYDPAMRTPVMERYAWERQFLEEMRRAQEAGPSQPRMPPNLQLPPPAAFLSMHREVRRTSEEAQQQGLLLFEASDTAHKVAEQSIRIVASAQTTARTVRHLINALWVMGALMIAIVAVMIFEGNR